MKKFAYAFLPMFALALMVGVTPTSAAEGDAPSERQIAALERFATKDINAIVERLEERGMDEEKIEALREIHALAANGQFEEAIELRRDANVGKKLVKKAKRAKHKMEIHQAVEANDFAAFREAVGEGQLGQIIDTEEEFAQLVRIHELKEAGDHEVAKAIAEELGLERPKHKANRPGKGNHTAVKAAVEANDYAAFAEAVDGTRLADVVDSESDFALFIEMHELRKAGDREGAKEIAQELGFTRGSRR